MTKEQQARERLKNEFLEVKKIRRNDIMTVTPTQGQTGDYIRSYTVTYNIPTYVDGGRSMQNTTVVRVDLPDNFPNTMPSATVVQGQVPFHVNWWENGDLCNGNFWNTGRWIWEYFVFIGEVLQFRPERVNIASPANHDAIPFFRNNPSKFPTDRRPIPRPSVSHSATFTPA